MARAVDTAFSTRREEKGAQKPENVGKPKKGELLRGSLVK
jgi:hypothetical protein